MNEKDIRYETYENIVDKSQLGLLTYEIIRCITKAFGQEMPGHEIDKAIRGRLLVVAKNNDDQVVGFSTLHNQSSEDLQERGVEIRTPDISGFYLGAATVDRDYQGRGIYRELIRYRLAQVLKEKAPIIVTVTQNPHVEKGQCAILHELVGKKQLTSFTIERRILSKLFGRRLTHDPLVTDNTPYSELNVEAGDAFFIEVHIVVS